LPKSITKGSAGRSTGWASHDLHCERNGRERRVEVKGTTSAGQEVLLTPNEVAHNHAHRPDVDLFLVRRIELSVDDDGEVLAAGGECVVWEAWALDDASLTPLGYSYRVPPDPEL
jgi:uncharacterized protein DUF3883